MSAIRFFSNPSVPLEMHKTRVVQKLTLLPVEERLRAIKCAGNNTFLLSNADVFLDMLTDSGVNAMSDLQTAAMMRADDSYAGSTSFDRLSEKLRDIFGKPFFLPAHQGRACEHLLAQVLVRPGSVVPMNYHFTTTKAHIERCGGRVVELLGTEGLQIESECPFKGNMDIALLSAVIAKEGANIPFVRLEAGTNLIGGQPISLKNMRDVHAVCASAGIPVVLDASLLADNLHFIKVREPACEGMSVREITREVAATADIIYFSARKLGCARGGGIVTGDAGIAEKIRALVPLFEGFLTYGGMSVREMEALAVGLEETMDEDMINQGPQFIAYMAKRLMESGVPVITPPGGLGCHVDASRFLPHVPQRAYPAGALAAAIYIAGGIRGMERGTLSESRDENGVEPLANMELVRLALPRRVFSLSQIEYAVDRIAWLFAQRDIIGGLQFVEEPDVLRFFLGRLEAVGGWQEELARRFSADFGGSL